MQPKMSIYVLQGMRRPSAEIRRPNREARHISISRFSLQHSMFDFQIHDPNMSSQHNAEVWLWLGWLVCVCVGVGGDLEANHMQGDIVIFRLWREFSPFYFLSLSIVYIQPNTGGVLPPRHLRRYLLMSKYVHEVEGREYVSLSRKRRCRNICLPFSFYILGLLYR